MTINANLAADALETTTVKQISAVQGAERSKVYFRVSPDGQKLWQIVGTLEDQKLLETDLKTDTSKTLAQVTPPTGTTRLPVGSKFRVFQLHQVEISDDGNLLAFSESDQTVKVTDQDKSEGSYMDSSEYESVGQPLVRWTILDLRSGAKYSVNTNSGLTSIPDLVISASTKKLVFQGCVAAKYLTLTGYSDGFSCKIYSSDLSGRNKKAISATDGFFQTSANGKFLATTNGAATFVLNLATNKRSTVKFSSYSKALAANHVQPTNDGKSILMSSPASVLTNSKLWTIRTLGNVNGKVVARGEVEYATLSSDNSTVYAATEFKTFAINLKSAKLASEYLNVKSCPQIITEPEAGNACHEGFVLPQLAFDQILSCVPAPGGSSDQWLVTYATKLVGGNYSAYYMSQGGISQSQETLSAGSMTAYLWASTYAMFGAMNEGSGAIYTADMEVTHEADMTGLCK